MARKPKQRAVRKVKAKTLAVYNGPPTEEEIEKIRKDHRAIVLAGRSMLPKAIAIGQWFLDCRTKGRIARGDWGTWMKSAFPEVARNQLQIYVRLAQHRQFLENKFEMYSERIQNSVDFQHFASIKEADTAIRDMRSAEKKSKTVGGQQKAIDVEATVSEATGTNGETERATRIGLDIETAVAQDDDKLADSVEDPDAPRTPMEEINVELSKSASCLRAASAFWQQALVIAQHHAIPSETMHAKLAEYLDDQSELALCFTTELHQIA
jgi:hypothetical protein